MGRTGTDMENANLKCFLTSDEASYISGQNIQIDGLAEKSCKAVKSCIFSAFL